MVQAYRFFVGIDWATEAHEVKAISAAGDELASFRVANNATGLHQLAQKLQDLAGGDIDAVAVGIEMPRGPVVETLVERGFAVFSINPKQLDRFRDRHAVSGAKDDRLDAFVLSDSLRTDMHCFRRVSLSAETIVILRELSRVDEELGRSRNRLINQLREQVMRFHPDLLQLSPAAEEPWFWELLEAIGDPVSVATFSEAAAAKLLARHGIRRLQASGVLTVVRSQRVTVAPGTVAAAMLHIKAVTPQLRVVHEQRQHIRKRINALLGT